MLYGQAVRARRRWYERHPRARRRLDRPVISVGNLAVGGTGKTPLVARLAEYLLSRGERPAILSRGYGRERRADGATVVADGTRVLAPLTVAGDEPLMLARAVPRAIVVVADDRYLAGVVAERRLGATVHVLDDGFQHLTLCRDLDVLTTLAGEIGRERPLPFGRLREPADAAARADLVVVLDTDAAGARSEAWTLGVSQAVAARRVLTGAVSAGRVAAVAAIARPDRFFRMLAEAGYEVAATIAFGDHHRYGPADVARIARVARDAGAPMVVTTEKDAIRLERFRPLPFLLEVVGVALQLDDGDLLAAAVDTALARRREAA